MQIRMQFKKQTKGTWVYEEIEIPNTPLTIPTLYVRKHLFTTPPVTILVEVLDEGE